MFKTSTLFIAAAVLTTISVQGPALSSDGKTTVRNHRTQTASNVRDHRTSQETNIRDHRTQNPTPSRKNEVVQIRRKDCRVGYEILRRAGYDPIVAYDCEGAEYHYTAQLDASLFSVSMNAYSGVMKTRFIGLAQSN